MYMVGSLANASVKFYKQAAGTITPRRVAMLAITAIAIYALLNLPTALGAKNLGKSKDDVCNAYTRCLSACRQYKPDDPEIMRCFQRCREFYGSGCPNKFFR